MIYNCDPNYLFLYLQDFSQVRNELCYSLFGYNAFILFTFSQRFYNNAIRDILIIQLHRIE